MTKTIGVCGNYAAGSGAFLDLLYEFDDAQLLIEKEFMFTYLPDGLEDLDYYINNYHKYFSSVVAINRFRKFIKSQGRRFGIKKEIIKLTEGFLSKIILLSWEGHGYVDMFIRSSAEIFIKRSIFTLAKITRFGKLSRFYLCLFPHKIEFSIMPEGFDSAAKQFTSDILDAIGRDINKVTVLDQPFEACNPIKSFKYFDNPKAIIVDRDPRDLYLFLKCFVRPKGMEGYQVPCDNVDDFIKYYHIIHKKPSGLENREDLLYINFEKLIYDYDNTVEQIKSFAQVSQHMHKGKYFKPAHSRNNTQLFKKYSGFESDIKKIETELYEYLFPFDKYPDIQPEGKMFWDNPIKKQVNND